MTIRVEKLCHHVSPSGKEIASFELYYPREILHEEALTHRSLSRNASSSRATPITSMIDQVRADPALPSRWGLNGKGMSDHGEMTPEEAEACKAEFLAARDDALEHVGNLMKMDRAPHKQIVNLLLRPWEHITVVVTATEWTNFFALRRHADAKPEFYELADKMWKALKATPPVDLAVGEWHLPYIRQHELESLRLTQGEKRAKAVENLKKISAARCARTSYKNHRGKVASLAEDVELFNRLATGGHMSPMEHQATPDTCRVVMNTATKKFRKVWDHPELHGNLVGYVQLRKTLPNECVTEYNPED